MTRIVLLVLLLAFPATARADDPKPEQIFILQSKSGGFFDLNSQSKVISVDPSTGKVKVLTPESFHGDFGHPLAISPDGKRAVCHRWAVDGNVQSAALYLFQLDDPKAKPKRLPVYGDAVCWTPDGKNIVVSEDAEWRKAHHLVDAATITAKEFDLPKTDKPKDPKGRWGHVVLDVSPDGKHWLTKIVIGDASETSTGLYLVARDGSGAKAIEGAGAGAKARFSPDGKTILYQVDAKDFSGPSKLFTVPTVGGKPKSVAIEKGVPGFASDLCWSPDGKRIAYVALAPLDPNPDAAKSALAVMSALIVADADGKNSKVLLKSTDPVTEVYCSPVWR